MTPDRAPRCAVLARAAGYRPAGTAASAAVFLLVEVPLPWPGEITEHRLLQPVAPIAAAHGARVQAVVPDEVADPAPPGTSRVILYRRPPGPFRRFDRHERLVPTTRLADEVAALLNHSSDHGDSAGPADPRDILVCTHGNRDVCCGGDGLPVYRDLTALAPAGARVWRTSHTGGHRFAPTALTFPDGRAWASVDAETLVGIVTRSLGPREAVTHHRGCAAFGDPFVQAAEGAVLAVEGWPWLDRPREVDSVTRAEGRRAVTVTGHASDAGPANADRRDDGSGEPWRSLTVAASAPLDHPVTYRADVVVRRVVPVPDCGRPLDEARKSAPELEVVAVDRLGEDGASGTH